MNLIRKGFPDPCSLGWGLVPFWVSFAVSGRVVCGTRKPEQIFKFHLWPRCSKNSQRDQHIPLRLSKETTKETHEKCHLATTISRDQKISNIPKYIKRCTVVRSGILQNYRDIQYPRFALFLLPSRACCMRNNRQKRLLQKRRPRETGEKNLQRLTHVIKDMGKHTWIHTGALPCAPVRDEPIHFS